MIKTLATITLMLLTAGVSVAALANDPSNDSTNMPIPNGKNIQAQTIINSGQCVSATQIQAIFVLAGGSTNGQKTSVCPAGYTATGIQSNVKIGANSGYYRWQTYCCQSYVGYQS